MYETPPEVEIQGRWFSSSASLVEGCSNLMKSRQLSFKGSPHGSNYSGDMKPGPGPSFPVFALYDPQNYMGRQTGCLLDNSSFQKMIFEI